MENMEIYNKVRACPDDALKKIKAGRLIGKSDINPMWRIKQLTELFGPVGIGWYYNITKQWTETGANGEIAAFCNIDLFVKVENEWSKPIQGTGGSSFVAKESKGLYTSDECYKMALTDAISVSCKALGFAANVYWDTDRTKYSLVELENGNNTQNKPKEQPKEQQQQKEYKCVGCGKLFEPFTSQKGVEYTAGQAYHMTERKYGKAMCINCRKKEGLQA